MAHAGQDESAAGYQAGGQLHAAIDDDETPVFICLDAGYDTNIGLVTRCGGLKNYITSVGGWYPHSGANWTESGFGLSQDFQVAFLACGDYSYLYSSWIKEKLDHIYATYGKRVNGILATSYEPCVAAKAARNSSSEDYDFEIICFDTGENLGNGYGLGSRSAQRGLPPPSWEGPARRPLV